MDHKLAIAVVPPESSDAVEVPRMLLAPYRGVQPGGEDLRPSCKFRYMRVGGWFDGLIDGQVGQERWSTVLRMRLDGAATTAEPFPNFGPEATTEIESRIKAGNVVGVNKIWPSAPCSIIVTPDGRWLARPAPEHFDDAGCGDDMCLAWIKTKRDVFSEYRDAIAVA